MKLYSVILARDARGEIHALYLIDDFGQRTFWGTYATNGHDHIVPCKDEDVERLERKRK